MSLPSGLPTIERGEWSKRYKAGQNHEGPWWERMKAGRQDTTDEGVGQVAPSITDGSRVRPLSVEDFELPHVRIEEAARQVGSRAVGHY